MRFASMDRKPSAISAEMPSSAPHQTPAGYDRDILVDRKDIGELAESALKFALVLAEPDLRLAKSKATLEPQDRHSCNNCNQEFDSRLALSIHVGRVHKECVAGSGGGNGGGRGDSNSAMNKRTHTCHLCDKSFYSASYLSQHLRIHSGLKPYGCQVCARRFTQLSHLQQHRRTHTGEKPYKCKQPGCTKAFSQLSNLQSHSRSHMTDRTYKCTSCYKCFLDKESLFNHMSTHLGTRRVRAFACHMCDKSYTQDTYLQNHIKVKHSGSAAVAEKTRANISTQQHQQHHQQRQLLQLAEERASDPETQPTAPRPTPTADLLSHRIQYAGELERSGPQSQQQLLQLQRREMPAGNLLLASLGVAAAGDRRFLPSHHGRHQPSPTSSGSHVGGVPVSVVCPSPLTNVASLPMSIGTEQTLTALPQEACSTGPPIGVSPETTAPAELPLGDACSHDLLLSASPEKEQMTPVVSSSIINQIGGSQIKSPAPRTHLDAPSCLTALGESYKVDSNWQFGGPGALADACCPSYFSPYMHADLHALQMSLSQHEPYRWPSCSAEIDHQGFSLAQPGSTNRMLANPPLGPPYWLCSDSAYKQSGALSRSLFGGSSGSLFDGIGGAMSPYGLAGTPSVSSVESFVHSDLLSLTKVQGHSGFGSVHFSGL